MCGKSTNDGFSAVVSRLGAAGSLLALTHNRPDGDGLGSIVALAKAARSVGKTAHICVLNEMPLRYAFLFEGDPPAGHEKLDERADQSELIVIADTCALRQLEGIEGVLSRHRRKIVVIDHHITRDDIADVAWIDTTAAAVGVMVGELLEELDWPVTPDIAEALLTAVMCDTGWMRFSNTDARALRAVANLLEAGAQADRIYTKLYQSDRPQRLRLLERMLASLEMHCGGQLALMTIRKRDFAETGARADETENLINEALRLESVEVALLLTECTDCVRVSLRSRRFVNVAGVAKQFGGGGHARAAGCSANEDIKTVRKRIIDVCAVELKKAPAED